MKKIVIAFMSCLCVLTIFFSCEKDEQKDDKELPNVSEIKINWGDTIMHNGKIIYINIDTLNVADRIDTLLVGRSIRFSARFQDDKGLSSYMIRLFSKDERIDNGVYDQFTTCSRLRYTMDPMLQSDTAICLINSWSSTFGKTDTTIVNQSDVFIPDSITKAVDGQYKKLPIRQGVYYFNVYSLDKSGKEFVKEDSVRILYKDSILNYRP